MILYYNKEGEPISREEWTRLFEDLEYRHIRMTAVDDEVEVSTVWIGIDHNFSDEGPPLIFETMPFGGEYDQTAWRWSSLEAADAGHEQIVALVKEGIRHD